MTDGDELLWTHKPAPPAKARPGELLFSLAKDGHRIACELRYHGEYGVVAQFLRDGKLWMARTFITRALAVEWVELECEALERDISRGDGPTL